MATRKAGKKSSKKGRTGGSSKTKSGKKSSGAGGRGRTKPLAGPQEPIIIGGGGSSKMAAQGVEIDFPKTFKVKASSNHDFKNADVALVQLVVHDVHLGVRHRMGLNPDDTIVVCFTTSLCS